MRLPVMNSGPPASQAPFTRELGLGSSTFFGFAPRRVDHLLSECDAQPAGVSPAVETLEDCVYVPGLHALYTREGVRIDCTAPTFLEPSVRRLPGQDSKLERENAEKCPGRIDIPQQLERADSPMLLMGTIIPHFGHFVTDCMARMWLMDEQPGDMPLLCLGVVREFQASYERVISGALGLAERLIAPLGATLFRKVVVPYPAIQLSRRIYSPVDRPHRRVAEVLGRALPARETPRPLYLSRSRLGAGFREVRGELELEAGLEARGFEIVDLNALSFAQQVLLFQTEQPIVAAAGSAMHGLLFRNSLEPARLGVLSSDYVHQRFLMQDAVKPTKTNYLNCLSDEPPMLGVRSLKDMHTRIDVKRALEMIEDAGLAAAKPQPRSRRRAVEDPPSPQD